MEGIGAYGGGKAGGAFDPVAFIRRPQVILRVVCWVCKVLIILKACTAETILNNRF